MSTFQPPPTWALPIILDENSGKATFNPIWLRWFLDLSRNFTAAGTPTAGSAEDIIAGQTFEKREPTVPAWLALDNAQTVLTGRLFERTPDTTFAQRALTSNSSDVLQSQVFIKREPSFAASIALDNTRDVFTGRLFSVRQPTHQALTALESNSSGILASQIFGA